MPTFAIGSDSIGEPKQPPCESCHRSNSECILVRSRRGAPGVRGQKHKTLPTTMSPATGAERPTESSRSANAPDPLPTVPSSDHLPIHSGYYPGSNDESNRSRLNDDDVDDLHMELRNPSDALQILSQVQDSPHGSRSSQQSWATPNAQFSEASTSQTRSVLDSMASTHVGINASAIENASSSTLLDGYELVQRGLLHPAVVPELLHVYVKTFNCVFPYRGRAENVQICAKIPRILSDCAVLYARTPIYVEDTKTRLLPTDCDPCYSIPGFQSSPTNSSVLLGSY